MFFGQRDPSPQTFPRNYVSLRLGFWKLLPEGSLMIHQQSASGGRGTCGLLPPGPCWLVFSVLNRMKHRSAAQGEISRFQSVSCCSFIVIPGNPSEGCFCCHTGMSGGFCLRVCDLDIFFVCVCFFFLSNTFILWGKLKKWLRFLFASWFIMFYFIFTMKQGPGSEVGWKSTTLPNISRFTHTQRKRVGNSPGNLFPSTARLTPAFSCGVKWGSISEVVFWPRTRNLLSVKLSLQLKCWHLMSCMRGNKRLYFALCFDFIVC